MFSRRKNVPSGRSVHSHALEKIDAARVATIRNDVSKLSL